MSLWACLCYAVAGARSLILGIRKYPFWTLFLAFTTIFGAVYSLRMDLYRRWWSTTEYAALILQLAVTVEAYWILARQVPNFRPSTRVRTLAILSLVGVVAAAGLTLDNGGRHRWANYFNQVAGFGLGSIAATGFFASLPFLMSRNSLIHAATIAVMWISSGVAYRMGAEDGTGRLVLQWVPASAAALWALCVSDRGEITPSPDAEALRKATAQLEEAQRRARGAGL